jgi:hypothetical protein
MQTQLLHPTQMQCSVSFCRSVMAHVLTLTGEPMSLFRITAKAGFPMGKWIRWLSMSTKSPTSSGRQEIQRCNAARAQSSSRLIRFTSAAYGPSW